MYLNKRLAFALLLALGAVASGQVNSAVTSKSDAEVQKEDQEAEALYQQQNFLGALPLYEDLHQQRPDSNLFRERLAMALLAKASSETPPSDTAALWERAKRLLLDAKAAGDDSNLLQVVLEKLSQQSTTSAQAPTSPGAEALHKAEKAFSSGDLNGALVLYKQAADADPRMYEAPLFAGDAEYKLKDYDAAGIWYAKAIAIDPDRETAYRYWGDCLMHKGDQKLAQSKFIDAIIANPYSNTTWIGLKQWAAANHAQLASPAITLPKQPVPDAKGNVNVIVDASTLGGPTSGAWLIYSMSPMTWRSTEFKKHYPNETVYRHSLAEQAESLRSVLSVVKEQKIPDSKLDATLKSLIALDKDGMLECWILLNGADQGIAQDYVAYRATHRPLLHAYIEKYVIHSS
jgi:tetratricopeptide (TPR) repeat protein